MISVKSTYSQTYEVTAVQFDSTFFDVQASPTYTQQPTYVGTPSKSLYEVYVKPSGALSHAIQWVNIHGPNLSMLTTADILALKNFAQTMHMVNDTMKHIDMTNPHIAKAFETFLVVAKLHGDAKVDHA